jgi:uncharacterized phiE125 gp8 family phage protein
MLTLRQSIPPAVEPVTLAQAKGFLNIDEEFTQDDALLTALITAARQYAEEYTCRAFFNQTFVLTRDYFPYYNGSDYTTVNPASRGGYELYANYFRSIAIYLPRPGCVSVTSIKYVDLNGVIQTLDSGAYHVDTFSEPGCVLPSPGTYWPYTATNTPGAVQVTYIAGSYGDGTEVNSCPQTICTAILLLVSHWYSNREAASPTNLSHIPFGVNVMLDTVKFHDTYFGAR